MKAKLIGGVMMGMLLCVGTGNVAKAQGCGRGGVSFSLSVGTPMGGGYVSSGPGYCPPPPPVAYCPPAPVAYCPPPVVYQRMYRRPHCGPGYYNGPACGGYGAPVVYNNYYNGGHGRGYNNGRHNGWGPRGCNR